MQTNGSVKPPSRHVSHVRRKRLPLLTAMDGAVADAQAKAEQIRVEGDGTRTRSLPTPSTAIRILAFLPVVRPTRRA